MKPLETATVINLFARLQARYGRQWTSLFPTDEMVRFAAQEWADGLAGCSPDDLARGLHNWTGDWPPNLPQFKKACLGIVDPTSNEEWAALGNKVGCHPGMGESWQAYISRVKEAVNNPGTVRKLKFHQKRLGG